MRELPILWQRLVTQGATCPRCGSTLRALEAAVARLEPALRVLGLRPVLETRVIDEAAFRPAPEESNRIWIGGRPMEEWLGARAGHSRCCEACGDLPCRTLEVEGQSYEAVPAELIVKAALIAAAQQIGPGAGGATPPCCASACGRR